MIEAPEQFRTLTENEALGGLVGGVGGALVGGGILAYMEWEVSGSSVAPLPAGNPSVSPVHHFSTDIQRLQEGLQIIHEFGPSKTSSATGAFATVRHSLEHDLRRERHEQAKQHESQPSAAPQPAYGHDQSQLEQISIGGGATLIGVVVGAVLVSILRHRRHERRLDAITSLESDNGIEALQRYLEHRRKKDKD